MYSDSEFSEAESERALDLSGASRASGEFLVEELESRLDDHKKRQNVEAKPTSRKRDERGHIVALTPSKKTNEAPPQPVVTPTKKLKPGEEHRGEFLYRDAVAERKRAEERCTEIKTKKEEALNKELKGAFAPKISRNSTEIAQHMGYRPPQERFDAQAQRLAREALLRQHRKDDELTEDCTFAPQIEPCSKAIVSRIRSGGRPEETGSRLYRDNHERQMRHQLRSMCVDREVRGNMVGGSRVTRAQSVETAGRLNEWRERRELLVEEMRNEIDRQKVGARIHVDPSEVVTRLTNPNQDMASVDFSVNDTRDPHIGSVSRSLANASRDARFKVLFKDFDPTGAGTTTVANIQLVVKRMRSNSSLLTVFRRHAATAVITEAEFVSLLTDFERRYGPQNFGRGDKHLFAEKEVHQPQLTKATQKLVSKRKRALGIYEDLYHRGLKEQEKRDQRTERKAKQLEKAEVEGCTFKPEISQRSKKLSERQLTRTSDKIKPATTSATEARNEAPQSPATPKSPSSESLEPPTPPRRDVVNRIEVELRASDTDTSTVSNLSVTPKAESRRPFEKPPAATHQVRRSSGSQPTDLLDAIYGVLKLDSSSNVTRIDNETDKESYVTRSVSRQISNRRQH